MVEILATLGALLVAIPNRVATQVTPSLVAHLGDSHNKDTVSHHRVQFLCQLQNQPRQQPMEDNLEVYHMEVHPQEVPQGVLALAWEVDPHSQAIPKLQVRVCLTEVPQDTLPQPLQDMVSPQLPAIPANPLQVVTVVVMQEDPHSQVVLQGTLVKHLHQLLPQAVMVDMVSPLPQEEWAIRRQHQHQHSTKSQVMEELLHINKGKMGP